jgi:hypothetical protein
MRGRRRTAALVLVVLLGACSDEGGGDAVVGDPDATTTTSTGVTIGGADDGSGSTTLADANAFADGCGQFASAFSSLAATLGFGTDGPDQEALDEFNAAVDDAPDDLQDDLQTYRDTFQQYAQGLRDAGIDPASGDIDPDDVAQVGQLSQLFTTPEFLAASQAINDFIAANCHAADG